MTMTASVLDGATVIETGDSIFNLFLLMIVTQTPVDMAQQSGEANEVQTILVFSIDPSAAPVPAYTFTYTLGLASGGAAPSWISIVGNTDIEIDSSTAVDGTYALELTGTVVEEPTRSKSVPFTVTVFTFTASTLIDQVFAVGESADYDYTFPPFTLTPASYATITYTLLIDGSLAPNTFSWVKLDAATNSKI